MTFFTNASSGRLSKRIGISRTLAEKMVSIVLDTSFQVLFSLVYIPQMATFAPVLYIPALLVIFVQILLNVLTPLLSSFGTVLLLSIMEPGQVGQAEYIAFNESYSYIIVATTQLLSVIQSAFLMKPLMDYMKPVLDVQTEQTTEAEYVTGLQGEISVQNLTFAYAKNPVPVLKNISLTVGAGEKIAIVGQSGCGKSTLLKLLMGFEKSDSGKIFYDGKELDALNKSSLRKKIGSVLQSSRLMPGTIAENIAFAADRMTEADVWAAAAQAQIAEFIRSLDMGLDTEITQSNVGGFSGGQKQCMLLARAFATKPSVLFLDEATSALDNVTQKKVLDAISAMQAI